jgi:hypothetical protein
MSKFLLYYTLDSIMQNETNHLLTIAVHRRGGRPSGVGNGSRKKQARTATQRRRRSTSTSDENSSDGGSVTRCICGETRKLFCVC